MNSRRPAEEPDKWGNPMDPNFRDILPLLVRQNVRFIVIGGGAALAHVAAR